jgi:hypothetical protein
METIKKLRLSEWISLLFFVVILYVLVRPSSKANELIKAFTEATVAIVKTATDL